MRGASHFLRTRGVRDVTGLVVLAGFLLVGFDAINSLAPMRTHQALAHGNAVLDFERHLHLSFEASASTWLAHHRWLAWLANWTYNTCQIVITSVVLVLLWWRHPVAFRRLRWPLVGANLLALLVFWLYPVAPPRLLPGRGVVDTIATIPVAFGWKPGIVPGEPNQFQALPSLHAAWSTWVAVAIFAVTRKVWARCLAVCYPLLVGVLVIATGTHTLVDVVAGMSTTLLLTLLMSLVLRPRPEHMAVYPTDRPSTLVHA